MAIGDKRLCDLCLASFAKEALTRAGSRYLCEQCARLQGVESRGMPRVVVRRPALETPEPAARPARPRPYVPRAQRRPRAEAQIPALYELVESPGADLQPASKSEARSPTPAPASAPPPAHSASQAPQDLQAFGAEIVRCLAEGDLAGFERLFVRERELRAIVGREAAKAHARLIQSRIARDFESKRKLYARQAGALRFERAEAGRAVRTSGEVVELHDVQIHFRIGAVARKLVIRRMYRVGERYRLEFFE